MLERTFRQAQATTPCRLETTCYKGSKVSEERRGNLGSRKLGKNLDVAVCEFRLITEPSPGLQDGAAAYVRLSPSGTQGEKVPLRRHPIPCRSPVLAAIELNKKDSGFFLHNNVSPQKVLPAGELAGELAGESGRRGVASMPGCSEGDFSVYASHLRAALVRGFGWTATTAGPKSINLVSILERSPGWAAPFFAWHTAKRACPLPHNSLGLPPCEANSMRGIEWCWRDSWCD